MSKRLKTETKISLEYVLSLPTSLRVTTATPGKPAPPQCPFSPRANCCSSIQEAFYSPAPYEMNGIQVLKRTFCECRPETLFSLGTGRLDSSMPACLGRLHGIARQITELLQDTCSRNMDLPDRLKTSSPTPLGAAQHKEHLPCCMMPQQQLLLLLRQVPGKETMPEAALCSCRSAQPACPPFGFTGSTVNAQMKEIKRSFYSPIFPQLVYFMSFLHAM